MLNNSGISKTSYLSQEQILANVELQASIGVMVPATLGTVQGSKKIVSAGTPVFVDLNAANRLVAAPAVDKLATGVLLHPVDVTSGTANGTLLIFGFVNTNRLTSAVKLLITDEVKTALDGKVYFINA